MGVRRGHVDASQHQGRSHGGDPARRRCCHGPCRERRLSKLPDAHMFVGRTPLTLHDIRAWNTLQEQVRGPQRWRRLFLLCLFEQVCLCAVESCSMPMQSCAFLRRSCKDRGTQSQVWSATRCPPLQDYELHRNDCRHYINCLVKYTTGALQRATGIQPATQPGRQQAQAEQPAYISLRWSL